MQPIETRLVEIGCATCRALNDAIASGALESAYYVGITVGLLAGQGRVIPLCARCYARWKLIMPRLEAAVAQGAAEADTAARERARRG